MRAEGGKRLKIVHRFNGHTNLKPLGSILSHVPMYGYLLLHSILSVD